MQVRDPADLGRLLRVARSQRDWSQQQAAEAAGISRRLVNQLESGQHPNAELWRVLALLGALDVSLHADLHADLDGDVAEVSQSQDDIDLEVHLATFRSGSGNA